VIAFYGFPDKMYSFIREIVEYLQCGVEVTRGTRSSVIWSRVANGRNFWSKIGPNQNL